VCEREREREREGGREGGREQKKGHNNGRNGLTVRYVGKKEKWIVQMLQE
jgi:hypothetical protein